MKVLVLILGIALLAPAQSKLRDESIKATNDYKASLVKLSESYQRSVVKAQDELRKSRSLYESGLLSIKEVEASERAVAREQDKVKEVQKRIASADKPIRDPLANPQAQTTRLIRSTTPFEASSTLTLEPDKIETGNLNGVAYRFYYSDGSGLFAGTLGNVGVLEWSSNNWMVGCEKDAITDAKSCHMDKGDIRIWVDSRGRSEIYIGSDHYPGSLVVIRIDSGAPIAINSRMFDGSFGYKRSPAILQKLGGAKTVTTRYQKWPYTGYEDETSTPSGLKEALAYIRWAVVRIK